MKNKFWDKKIPTFLGLILIVIGIGVTTFLVKQGGLFSIKASPSSTPQEVRISNVTDNSFTISYNTSDQITAVLNYGDSTSLGQSALDDRDQESNNVTNHTVHNITVRNLDPNKKYYFTIISGKDTYMNNTSPYEVTTGTTINSAPPQQDPITGKIILPSGNPPSESIMYLTVSGSQVISTLIKSDGSFILPLNSLRKSDLSSYFILDQTQAINLLILGDSLTSNVILSLKEIHPVPTITLSSDYDFTGDLSPVASASANLESFPVFSSNQTSGTQSTPQILSPKKDQGLTDQQPQFKGTAAPNETVQITIHSDSPIQTNVKTDSNGNWTYRPDSGLSPGNHTITIAAKDASGVIKTITQSFVVYASGNQVNGAAGSPTPTTVPSLTPTTPPALSPTDTQIEPSAIDSPTDTPTLIPADTSLLSPTPSTVLPATGNPTIVTAGVIGLLISLIGGLLFLLSRGGISAL